MSDTRDSVLDAAERLFAERGFTATSVRAITTEAGVNLASVNYHFGTKDALTGAVFSRRLGPMNRERLLALDRCEEEAGDGTLPLEDVVEAFVGPVLRLGGERHDTDGGLGRLFARIYSESSDALHEILYEQFNEVKKRYVAAFQRALPDLPRDELFWKMHFVISTVAQTLQDPHRLTVLSGGLCDPSDIEGVVRRIVPFLSSGMRAPVDTVKRSNLEGAVL